MAAGAAAIIAQEDLTEKPGEHAAQAAEEDGVADGTRTHDNRNHNPGLYQLSYSHHR